MKKKYLNHIYDGDVVVESLQELSSAQAAEQIARHFSAISNEYNPINYEQLPAFLPAQLAPQVEEYEVYNRLCRLRKTRSTLPIDIPQKIRNECSAMLAGPLCSIINHSLTEGTYPDFWKREWVTPVPKVSHPKVISDLRKISGTSDFSKVYEGFLKDWVMQDIHSNLDIAQFGGQSGMGTEHMMVCLLDRILKLLDRNNKKSADNDLFV